MELSVVIPTRNRPDSLKRALSSISCQSIQKSCFEVIVVDNGPSHETAAIAKSFMGKIANLRYFEEISSGLHNARHKGMREARSEVLVYIDDDVETFPDWLEGIKEGFGKYNAAMVGGKNIPRWEVDPPEWLKQLWPEAKPGALVCGYLSLLDFGNEVKEIDPSYIWGCNFSIKKSILIEVGGFHPDAMPGNLLKYRGDGETAVSMKIRSLRYKTIYNPRASVYHYVPKERMTFEYLYKRSFAQGISDSYTDIRRNGGSVFLSRTGFFLKKMRENMALAIKRPPRDICDVRQTIRRGYWDGVAYHIREVRDDLSLLQWVMKTDYLEN
jgi:glycosyltransferase involved in cell wall biosynthesis